MVKTEVKGKGFERDPETLPFSLNLTSAQFEAKVKASIGVGE